MPRLTVWQRRVAFMDGWRAYLADCERAQRHAMDAEGIPWRARDVADADLDARLRALGYVLRPRSDPYLDKRLRALGVTVRARSVRR